MASEPPLNVRDAAIPDAIVACPACRGKGRNVCRACAGHKKVECPDCNGHGEEMCPNCDGKGEITRTDKLIAADTEEKVTGGVIRRTEQCMRCSARGYLQGEPCQRCDGEGVVGCPSCEGKGYKTCKTCRGIGKLTSEEMERYERRQLIHGIIIAAAFLLIVGLVVWAICQAK